MSAPDLATPDFARAVRALAAGRAAPFGLDLRLETLRVRLASNHAALMDDLRGYFTPFLDCGSAPAPGADADLTLTFLDGPEAEAPAVLATRPHQPGKRPDKERSADLPPDPEDGKGGEAGRLVRKQATGMLFAFGERGTNLAVGPCAQNRNQLVNFLCARVMERQLAAGWALGHAAGAAIPHGGPAMALCGFAGMGKSTLALHLLARGLDFVSNDRVLVEPRAGQAPPILHGIPKHPRLNPGTALGNPELAPLLAGALPEAARRAYAHLSPRELQAVEDKYDARVHACFPAPEGRSRFRLAAPLAGLAVLNWRHGGGGLEARRITLEERPDLLAAFRKPPGVFYLPGALATAKLSDADLLAALAGVPVLELGGGADFPAAAEACLALLDHNH